MDENRAVMIEHRALSTDTVDVQCVRCVQFLVRIARVTHGVFCLQIAYGVIDKYSQLV